MSELRKPELPERRRSQHEIQADILRLSLDRGGVRITHLVYQANLNFEIVKKYLKTLITAGLLEHEGNRYYPTEKTQAFLDTLESLNNQLCACASSEALPAHFEVSATPSPG